MKRTCCFFQLLIAFCLLGPPPLFAARPLLTEDAGTAEKGFFELEIGLDYLRNDNRDKNYIPSAQLAYGLTERMEVGVGVGYIFKDIHEDHRVDGLGDVNTYLKYWVFGEGKYLPAFTLKPQAKFPTADEDKALGSGKADIGLTAIFSKSFTGFNLHFDLGYILIGEKGKTDVLNAGLACEYKVMKGLYAVGELRYGQNFNSHRKDDAASLLLGFQAPIGKVQADAAFTIGLNNAAPDYIFTIGMTAKFH